MKTRKQRNMKTRPNATQITIAEVLPAHITVIWGRSVAYPHANCVVPAWARIALNPIYPDTPLRVLARWLLDGVAGMAYLRVDVGRRWRSWRWRRARRPQQCGADSSVCVWSRDNVNVGCTWSLPTTRLVGALSFVSSQLG